MLSLVLVMAPRSARAATPTELLSQARSAFQMGKYDEAVPLLSYLLYPSVQLSRRSDLVEAHVLLGVGYFELGNRGEAKREFEEALFLDSELALDPLLFSESVVTFFEESKREFIERGRRDNEARALAEERDRLREALANMTVFEQKSLFINFVPFGAGQFQNGDKLKGIAFFASELVLGGLSAGAWYWQVEKYGLSGRVPNEEVGTVQKVQYLQLGTGIAFFVVTAGGIIDALLNYEPITRLPADESLLPDDLKLRPRGPKQSGLHLIPTAGPSGGGILMSWEF